MKDDSHSLVPCFSKPSLTPKYLPSRHTTRSPQLACVTQESRHLYGTSKTHDICHDMTVTSHPPAPPEKSCHLLSLLYGKLEQPL